MSELLIGTAALLVAAPVVWAVARLALRPFLRTCGRDVPQASTAPEEPDENRAVSPRPGASAMLTGPIGAVLLVAGVDRVLPSRLLHLIAREVQRVRWRREFDGWRIVQRRTHRPPGETGSQTSLAAQARRVHPRSGPFRRASSGVRLPRAAVFRALRQAQPTG